MVQAGDADHMVADVLLVADLQKIAIHRLRHRRWFVYAVWLVDVVACIPAVGIRMAVGMRVVGIRMAVGMRVVGTGDREAVVLSVHMP
jgi:hypothetical protein